ncbi:ABC transporter permease [Lachnospiraceae bacterium 42-17]|jgi:peptide/nickel transport system permease protein
MKKCNTRTRVMIYIGFASVYLLGIFFWGLFMPESGYDVNYADKLLPPGSGHLFGTDFMGRDMLMRSVKGISVSLLTAALAAGISSVIALAFGVTAAVFGGRLDSFVNWCVDLFMGIPHLVLLILISFMLGRGAKGVTAAVAFTHWPELTRVVRAEVISVRSSQYVRAAYKMGKSRFSVAWGHVIPHVLPVYLVGVILLFPHAVMHEASITFLGFGLPAEEPAIGVILSESMKYIAMGKWWLMLFPGLMLLLAVMLFDIIGENLKRLWNPDSGNE